MRQKPLSSFKSRSNSSRHGVNKQSNPIQQTDVTKIERADMLREYLEAFVAEFNAVPYLMPLDVDGKAPVIQNRCPLDDDEGRSYLVDGRNAVRKIREEGVRGYALYAGKPAHNTQDVVLVDVDDRESFPYESFPETLTVLTGSGRGEHFTYRNGGSVENATGKDGVDGEVRAENWYCVTPGSIHPSGGVYHVIKNCPIATLYSSAIDQRLRPSRIRENDTEPSGSSPSKDTCPPSLPQNPDVSMRDVVGGDSFEERWNRVINEPWGQEGQKSTFIAVMNGNYRGAGYVGADGYPDRSAAELTFARYVGFWFGRSTEIARFVFEELSKLEKYHENPAHRSDMFSAVATVDWCYTDDVSLDARIAVAKALRNRGEAKKAVIVGDVGWSERTVRRALRYFREEDVVQMDRRGQDGVFWTDTGLAEFIETYENCDGSVVAGEGPGSAVAD